MNRLLPSLARRLILTAAAVFAADVKETVHVVITGGPHAGTYDGTIDRGGCSAGMTGKDSGGESVFAVEGERSEETERSPAHRAGCEGSGQGHAQLLPQRRLRAD